MEFLWPILAEIELIGQQPQVSGANPTSGVPERMTGGWWGGLAMLELIENVPLRNIMTMGAKFRETPPCNKNKLTYLYRDAIEQLTKSSSFY